MVKPVQVPSLSRLSPDTLAALIPEQSLGVFGSLDKLPPREVREINSMCGHGMVSFNLIKKVIEEVKLGRMTPEQGAHLLAKPCECGAFNLTRARQVLEAVRMKG